jgi:hypothetical protein
MVGWLVSWFEHGRVRCLALDGMVQFADALFVCSAGPFDCFWSISTSQGLTMRCKKLRRDKHVIVSYGNGGELSRIGIPVEILLYDGGGLPVWICLFPLLLFFFDSAS